MANFCAVKSPGFRITAFIMIMTVFICQAAHCAAVKGWAELKCGIQFIDTTITQLNNALPAIAPAIVVNHEIFPVEISYCILSDNGIASILSFGYSAIGGENDKYYSTGTIQEYHKVDFSRLIFLVGGRKYFGSPGKEDNTCWYFGADLGLSTAPNSYIEKNTYALNGDLTGSGRYEYNSVDVVFRASVGAEYWVNKYIGFAVSGGYVWDQPHISGTSYGIADRDFAGAYLEAAFLWDIAKSFERKKKPVNAKKAPVKRDAKKK